MTTVHRHQLRQFLTGHTVIKAQELGWDTLSNGDLLRAAEEAAFDVLLTTDKNIRYQQNLAKRVIAIVVLGNSRWRLIQQHLERVVTAINTAKTGTYFEVEIPNQ